MVVEDDPVTRRVLCHAIQRESSLHLCTAVGTVREARQYPAQSPIDLLLTDLGLPDGSGVSVIRECRQRRPRADILVITMSSDEEQILACIDAGAVGYVLKETVQLDILNAIVDLRAGGSPISPVIARKVLTRMRTEVDASPLPASRKAGQAGPVVPSEARSALPMASGECGRSPFDR